MKLQNQTTLKLKNLTGIGNFKNGKWDGTVKWYLNTTGELKSIGEYKKGVRHGIWNNYYMNGQLENQFQFMNGKFLS